MNLKNEIIEQQTVCLVQCQHAQLPSKISGYTLEIFLEAQGLERGLPCLVRTIGWLFDMINREIRLRKLKLRLRDKRFANHKAPCTVIWQQPLQSVLALRGLQRHEFIFIEQHNKTTNPYKILSKIIQKCFVKK